MNAMLFFCVSVIIITMIFMCLDSIRRRNIEKIMCCFREYVKKGDIVLSRYMEDVLLIVCNQAAAQASEDFINLFDVGYTAQTKDAKTIFYIKSEDALALLRIFYVIRTSKKDDKKVVY